jgi:hypothetical protein
MKEDAVPGEFSAWLRQKREEPASKSLAYAQNRRV